MLCGHGSVAKSKKILCAECGAWKARVRRCAYTARVIRAAILCTEEAKFRSHIERGLKNLATALADGNLFVLYLHTLAARTRLLFAWRLICGKPFIKFGITCTRFCHTWEERVHCCVPI